MFAPIHDDLIAYSEKFRRDFKEIFIYRNIYLLKLKLSSSEKSVMQEDNKQDDSSVWSSYSDLFTNLAVIFLVMFVFALVKSGVNKIEQVKMKKTHENELQGKMSKNDIEKSKTRISKIEKTVEEMKAYETIIDTKVTELNTYAKKLQENKKILKDVIEAQSRQDSIMKMADEKLEEAKKQNFEKQAALEEAKLMIDLLNQEVAKAQSEVRQREDIVNKTKQEMKAQIDKMATDFSQKDSDYKNKITEAQQALEKTKSQAQEEALRKQNELKLKVDTLTASLKATEEKAQKITNELNQASSRKSEQEQALATLTAQLSDIEGQLAKNKVAHERLASDKRSMTSVIGKMKETNEALKADYENLRKNTSGLESQNQKMTTENAKANSQLQNLEQRLAATESDAKKWRASLDSKISEADRLKSELAETQKKFNNLAQTMTKLKDSVKNDVANKLMEKFKENQLDAKVDPKTGEVILLSGEGFNFERGSAKLSKEAKAMLKKIIPVYAGVFFQDEKIVKQISSFNMEGHSSPSFGGKYVAPEVANPDAYSINMRLSAQRAASVANFLMSKEIGEYPHKDRLKLLLQSVGYGYMKPIPKQLGISRLPASEEGQDCGKWDCSRSQRVQINFILKDNMEEIHKIIDANGKIK
jgi:chromosome segregation ATPase